MLAVAFSRWRYNVANDNLYSLSSTRTDIGITRKDVAKIFIEEFAKQRSGNADAIGNDLLDQLKHRMSGAAGGSNRDLPTEIKDAIMDANGAKIARYAGSIAIGALRDVGSATLGGPRFAAAVAKAPTPAQGVVAVMGCLSGGGKLVLSAFWERLMQLDRNPYYFVSDDPKVVEGYIDYLTYTYLSVGRVQPQHTG